MEPNLSLSKTLYWAKVYIEQNYTLSKALYWSKMYIEPNFILTKTLNWERLCFEQNFTLRKTLYWTKLYIEKNFMLSKLLGATVQRCIYFIHSIKMSPVPHSFALKFTGTLKSKTKCIAMFHCALSISKSNVKCPRGHCSAFTFTGTIVLCPGFPLCFIVLNVFRSCYLNQ